MASLITAGRGRFCKKSVGGIRKLYFVPYGELGNVTIESDAIVDFDGSFEYYTFDVGTSSLNTTITPSIEQGMSFFEQSLTVRFHKLTEEDNREVRLMSNSEHHVFTEDYNGNVLCIGLYNGARLESGSISSGGSFEDFQGYEFTIKGKELCVPNFVKGAIKDMPFFGMQSATVLEYINYRNYALMSESSQLILTEDNKLILI